MTNATPLSLYVHIPWCIKKCPYCDFNSHEKNQQFDEQRYIDALFVDLETEHQQCDGRALSSIFFGGGTPSLFSAESIEKIITHARTLFKFDDTEITLEANPGTFEQDKFTGFNQAGINRLSIGIQSFNRSHLQTLGRIHDDEQALNAVETGRRAGFENMNIDLMFGLPEQTIEQALHDIKTACAFDVPHISHYQLTIEPNTYFHKHTPVLPESELLWDMQTQCQQQLANNGYQHYEISAYAKADKRSRHNINYWQFGDYIGIGAGAHGKLSRYNEETKSLEIVRRWKHRQPEQFMSQALNQNAVSGQNVLSQNEILFEFLLNALRLKAGATKEHFETNTGLDFSELSTYLSHIDSSLLILDQKKVATTDRGYHFLNEILEKLV